MKRTNSLVFAILLCLLIAIFAIISLHSSYKLEESKAQERVANTSFLIAEWIKGSFEVTDYVLRDILGHVEESDLVYPHPNPSRQKQLNDLIIEKMGSVDNVVLAGLFDKNCIITHVNNDELGWDGSDRDYCINLREDSKQETFVSNAFVSTAGPLNVTQARRYLPNKAGFHGFAAVGVNLDFFSDKLDQVQIGPHGVLAISDENDNLLARSPAMPEALGKKIDHPVLKDFTASGKTHETVRATSPIDDENRLYSIRKVADLPFVVIVGEADQDWQSDWKNSVWKTALGVVVLWVIILFAARIYWSYTKNKIADYENRELLGFVAEKIPDGYLYQLKFTPKPHFTHISSGATKLHGLSVEELKADSSLLYKQVDPDFLQEVTEKEKQCRENLEDFVMETPIINTRKERRWIIIKSQFGKDKNGEPLWSGMTIDITDRKQMEIELENQKSFIYSVLNAEENIVISTNGYNINYSNQAFLDFFEVKNIEEFRRKYGECICETFDTDNNEFVQKEMEGISWIDYVYKNRDSNHKCKITLPKGTRIFSISAGTFIHNGTELKVAVLSNITELENARKEIGQMLLQQSKLAIMGEMIDSIAHQWKQPINVIKMKTGLLSDDFEYGEINDEYLEKFEDDINMQISHMMSTLNEFRSFFRPNKSVEDFDVKEMIEKVLLLGRDEFMKNNLNIKINEYQKFSLNGVENEFKHLVLNLINNAKDAFVERKIENREININIYGDKNYFEIEDNAGGIPEHIIKDIFKANITTKGEGKGTGIGLYMSAQIAQKHGGNLSVINTESGAKFIFEIK